jgi:hypothetical protein
MTSWARRVTSLPGSISDHVADGFTFLGPDRIVVIDSREPERSQILVPVRGAPETASTVARFHSKFQEEPRTIGLVTPMGSAISETYKVGDIVARQRGGFLVVTTPKGKSSASNCDVEARDITTNKPVWCAPLWA